MILNEMRKFGTQSLVIRGQLHKDLQKVLDLALEMSDVDFSLVDGIRPKERQWEYFMRGRVKGLADGVQSFEVGPNKENWTLVDPSRKATGIDGYKVKGKHNYEPSKAVDIQVYVPGKPSLAYEAHHIAYVAGVIMTVAKTLGISITWGGNWDGDGELIFDQNLVDQPHFELDD